jgi:S1-C subfamily serine protease
MNKMKVLSLIIIALQVLAGCTISNCITTVQQLGYEPLHESYVNVRIRHDITVCDINNANKCLATTMGVAASGFAISAIEDEYFVLTAGHACDFSELNSAKENAQKELEGRSILITTTLTLTDFYGNEAPAEIIKIDETNDICLLKSMSHMRLRATTFAKNDPVYGERVVNIASPLGMFTPGSVLMFDGYYSGVSKDFTIFTVPARPGSSGSPVFNGRGEIVGMLVRASTVFENVGISVKLEKLKEFAAAQGIR